MKQVRYKCIFTSSIKTLYNNIKGRASKNLSIEISNLTPGSFKFVTKWPIFHGQQVHSVLPESCDFNIMKSSIFE